MHSRSTRPLASLTICLLLGLTVIACANSTVAPPPDVWIQPAPSADDATMFFLTSDDFDDGVIPSSHTCTAEDVSPPLRWNGAPVEAASFALIMKGSDTQGEHVTHWVLFNLPATDRSIPAAVPRDERLPGGAIQGRNDFGDIGYESPCPPVGNPHHFQFTLYALDTELDLQPGATTEALVKAMDDRVLAKAIFIGIHQRKAV